MATRGATGCLYGTSHGPCLRGCVLETFNSLDSFGRCEAAEQGVVCWDGGGLWLQGVKSFSNEHSRKRQVFAIFLIGVLDHVQVLTLLFNDLRCFDVDSLVKCLQFRCSCLVCSNRGNTWII